MVREFRRRFLLFCAIGMPAGAAVLWAAFSWKSSLAFALSFVLVGADFLWMSLGVERALGEAAPGKGMSAAFLLGMLVRTLLLLVVLYGILTFLPKESLGVIAGIGGPLVLLALAGAVRTRG